MIVEFNSNVLAGLLWCALLSETLDLSKTKHSLRCAFLNLYGADPLYIAFFRFCSSVNILCKNIISSWYVCFPRIESNLIL
jgi:hypothetical protein